MSEVSVASFSVRVSCVGVAARGLSNGRFFDLKSYFFVRDVKGRFVDIVDSERERKRIR